MGSNSGDVPAAQAAITVNGTTAGYITVSDNSPFYCGAIVNLSDGSHFVEMQICEIGASGLIGLRKSDLAAQYDPGMRPLGGRNYGRNDCSQFTTAYTIYQDRQFIYDTTRTVM